MKKLFLTILFTLVLSGGASADDVKIQSIISCPEQSDQEALLYGVYKEYNDMWVGKINSKDAKPPSRADILYYDQNNNLYLWFSVTNDDHIESFVFVMEYKDLVFNRVKLNRDEINMILAENIDITQDEKIANIMREKRNTNLAFEFKYKNCKLFNNTDDDENLSFFKETLGKILNK
jgi:hypothetical protein